MKIKEGYTLQMVRDEALLLPIDKESENDGVSLDPVSAELWQAMQERDSFSVETLAKTLMDIYDVDSETALEDCRMILDTWVEMGIAE